MLQRLESECSIQYKVNTYHYINYQDYVCTWQIHAQGLAPGLSLSIILTLLSMCGTKIILLWSTWTFACEQHKSIVLITYDFTFHVHILRFHWDFFFHILFHAEAATRKHSKFRHPRYYMCTGVGSSINKA